MYGLMLRRACRDIKKNAGRYLALMVLIGFAVFMVLSMMGSAMSIIDQSADYDKSLNVEDGQFTVFVPLSDAELDKITSAGVSVEKLFSLDYEVGDGSTIRVFRNRESIDLITLHEGRLAESDDEAVLERRYCEEHGIRVGDTFELGGKTFTITGTGASPDYNMPVRNLSDTAVDSVAFGLMYITPSAYDTLLAEGNSMKSEEYVYAYRLNGAMTSDELKAILEENEFDADAVDDPYFQEYWEEMVGRKDDLLEGIDDLNDGAQELLDGANELSDGVDEFVDGVDELADGVGELSDAMPELESGANDLYNGSSALTDGINAYTGGVSSAASGASELSSGLNELQTGCNALDEGSAQYLAGLQEVNSQAAQLCQSEDPIVANIAGSLYAATSGLLEGYTGIDQGIDGITGGAASAAAGASALSDGLNGLASNNDSLTSGASSLQSGIGAMRDGIGELSDGVGELNDGVGELDDGVVELDDGVDELVDGMTEYADGVSEFSDEANDLIDEVFDIDTANLMVFLTSADNPRIDAAADDVKNNLYSAMFVGVVALILFAYVISVFVVHSVDQESSVIGALYSLGVRRSALAFGYIVVPALAAFTAGVTGTLIAIYSTFGIPSNMQESFDYYSMPDMVAQVQPFLLVYGLVLPSLITILVNVLVIRGRLTRTPLSLLKNEQKAVKARDIKLGKMKFIPLFRIRQLLREMRTGFTVIFGMFLALLIVMLALNTFIYCYRVKELNVANTHYEYMYTYKYPEKEVPEGGYEAVFEETTKEFEGYNFDVALVGLTRDNPFFDLSALGDNDSEVVLSSSFAYKYHLSVGDEFTLSSKNGDKLYAFKVAGINDYQASMMVFMDIDACRDLFGESNDYFNAVFSDHALEIDSGRLNSTTTKKDIESASGVFVDSMKSLITTLIIAGAVIFAVVMYLMVKMMLDRAAFNISLVKVFGFKNGEVKKMYLDGNMIMIVAGALVCIPLCKAILNYVYPNFLVANVNTGLSQAFPMYIYGGVFAAILFLYLLISQVLFISIKRTTPALVLKNRE
jgi:putative ABC transport system permease protein